MTIRQNPGSPIFIEASNRETLEVVCFYTFACTNEEILEEIAAIRKLIQEIAEREFLDVLEILNYV